MKRDDDPNPWVTLLKLLLGAAVLIGVVGYALWYLDKQYGQSTDRGDKDWGIVSDSPLRR